MAPQYTRSYLFFILVIFFGLFFFILIKSSYKSLLVSELESSSPPRSVKSTIRRVIISSSADNQSIIFKDESPLVRLYLDTVRDTVCGLTLRTQEQSVLPGVTADKIPFNLEKRIAGEDWPLIGISMIGQKRLINIEWALRLVIGNEVPGDFIECGVWRGGSSVFARAVLKALDVNDRYVWVADSFQGLPKPRTQNDLDIWSQQVYLRVLI